MMHVAYNGLEDRVPLSLWSRLHSWAVMLFAQDPMQQAVEKMQRLLVTRASPWGWLPPRLPDARLWLPPVYCLGCWVFPLGLLGLAVPKCKRKGLLRAVCFFSEHSYSCGQALNLTVSQHRDTLAVVCRAELGGPVPGGWLAGPCDRPTPALQPA